MNEIILQLHKYYIYKHFSLLFILIINTYRNKTIRDTILKYVEEGKFDMISKMDDISENDTYVINVLIYQYHYR